MQNWILCTTHIIASQKQKKILLIIHNLYITFLPIIHITFHFLDPSFSVDLSLTFNCKITTVFLLQKSETKIYPILSLLPILEYIRQKSSPSLSPGPNEPKSNTKSILYLENCQIIFGIWVQILSKSGLELTLLTAGLVLAFWL